MAARPHAVESGALREDDRDEDQPQSGHVLPASKPAGRENGLNRHAGASAAADVSFEFESGGKSDLGGQLHLLRLPLAGRLTLHVGRESYMLEIPEKWKRFDFSVLMANINIKLLEGGIDLPVEDSIRLGRFISEKLSDGRP